MKISFIGHASILVETNGLKILSDPWWEGPCFGTQWWVYPLAHTDPVKEAAVDYIYISHGHHDHLHLGTLRRLPKGATYLVSDELDVGRFLKAQGFDVREVAREEEIDLGKGVFCRIVPTCNDDTMMTLSDGTEVMANLNDAIHAAPLPVQERMLDFLKETYGTIDYVFSGYGIASHFPCCYVVPGMDQAKTASNRQAHFNRQWVYIMDRLSPAMAFPFAADVALLEEDLLWSNEAIHNPERPTDVFGAMYPGSSTRAVDIAPGFQVEGGQVTKNILFEPVSLEKLKTDHERGYAVSNRTPKNSEAGLKSLTEILKKNVNICHDYLLEYGKDYKFLIDLKGDDAAIEIIKTGQNIEVSMVRKSDVDRLSYDIVLIVRYSYLRRCLTNKFGHEVLYVGSGCIFEYMKLDRVAENLHTELRMIVRKHTKPPKSRYGDQSKWLFTLKQAVKRLLGHKDEGLYDLKKWLVMKS